MTFGLTPEGFNRKRLPDIKEDQENAFISAYGQIDTQPQSVVGQLVGIESKEGADVWENLEDLYYSQYPNTAEGVSLDYLVALNGITRLPQTKTQVFCACGGSEGTFINEGSLALQELTELSWISVEDTIISASNADSAIVIVDTVSNQAYNVLIDGTANIYSFPIIFFDEIFAAGDSTIVSINGVQLSAIPFNTDSQTTIDDIASAIQASSLVSTATSALGNIVTFDSDFVSGNEIVATLNGVALSQVDFTSDQATTIGLLATEIQSSALVTSCTVTGARELTIVPVDEGTFEVDSIVATSGASQPVPIDQRINVVPVSTESVTINFAITTGGNAPTATIAFVTPTDDDAITAALTGIINANSLGVTATDNQNATISLVSDNRTQGHSFSSSSGMTVSDITTPVQFEALDFGPISAPIGSITEIQTPIGNWESVFNYVSGTLGRFLETDAELRLRRANSTRILGSATVEAIRARLLQQVTGVTQALVFENRTMTELDIVVTFDEDFVASNSIVFEINGTPLSGVTFDTSQLNTMQLLEVQLEAVEGIENVTVGGTGNRQLTIEMTQGYEIAVTDIAITGGASTPNSSIQGGRLPKSFESVVQGGTDEDIANKIWETKPAGIQTFGTTSFNITDSMGTQQNIRFSRPEPLYIWVTVNITLYSEETFPSNGIDLVKQAILEYGNNLNIGEDVLYQRVNCQIFKISGIASGATQLAFTILETETPSFGASDITVGDTQLAIFDIERIDAVVV